MALKFRVDGGVDLIVVGDAHASVEDAAGVPEGDGGFAAAVHFDVAEIVNGGYAFIAGAVADPARDVAETAVGILGADDELLLGAGFERGGGGEDFDSGDGGIGVGGAGGAGGDPFRDDAVFGRIGGETLAAAVGDGEGGLEQHQAMGGVGEGDAAAQGLAGEGVVVFVGVVTAEG